MDWTELKYLGSILILVQICCDVTSERNVAGFKDWNFSNSPEKNDRHGQRVIDNIEDVIKIGDSSLPRRDRYGVLRNGSPENNENGFDNYVFTPSERQVRLYGQLEEQHALIHGLNVHDSHKKRFYSIPWAQRKNRNKGGDWFWKEKLGYRPRKADITEKMFPLTMEEVTKYVSPVQEKILNEPVIKVSYGLNQNTRMHNFSPSYKDRIQGSDMTISHRSNPLHTEMNTANTEILSGPLRNGRPESFPRTTGVNIPLTRSPVSHSVDLTGNVRAATPALYQSGGIGNQAQGLVNTQLQELSKSVLDQLGDEGSKFVSIQLTKHPKLRIIWANIIARALIRQSLQIAQLDESTKSLNSSVSNIAPPQSGKAATTDGNRVNYDLQNKSNDEFNVSNSMKALNAETIMYQKTTATSQVKNSPNDDISMLNLHGISGKSNVNIQGKESVNPVVNREIQKFPFNASAHTNNDPIVTSQHVKLGIGTQPSTEPGNPGGRKEGNNGNINLTNHSLEVSVAQNVDGREPITSNITKNLAPNRASGKAHKQISSSQKGAGLFSLKKFNSGKKNYSPINQMIRDPVAQQEFPDFMEDPYLNQQQLLGEDGDEENYFEHKINSAGQIVDETLPSYNDTFFKADRGEANYVANSLQGDSLTTAQFAESLARNDKLTDTENLQNAQLLSAVLKEDRKIASIDNQQETSQPQQRPNSRGASRSASGNGGNTRTTSKTSGSPFEDHFGDAMVTSELQNDMAPNAISDITGANLGGFYGDYDMNEPKSSYMYGGQDTGADQTDLLNESDTASLSPQFDATPVPGEVVQAQKKHQIHSGLKHSVKHKKMRLVNKKAKSSPVSMIRAPKTKFKRVKTSESRFAVEIRPIKSQNQPATRDSEISPTSIIFGLTKTDMKELEKHLAHGGQVSDGRLGRGTKSEDEHKKQTEGSMEDLEDKTLVHKKSLTKSSKFSNNRQHVHVMVQQKGKTRKHFKPSLDLLGIRRSTNQKPKKINLASWEGVTDVLKSGLDQVRDIVPKVSGSAFERTMKNFDGQEHSNSHGLKTPAFERSLYKHSKGLRRGRPLNNKYRRNEIGKDSKTYDHFGTVSGFGVPNWSSLKVTTSLSEGRKLKGKRNLKEFETNLSDGTFRSPDFEKQLSQALFQENKHDLAYVGAVTDVDNEGFNTLINHSNFPSRFKTISPMAKSNVNDRLVGLLKSGEDMPNIKNSQEKLVLFFKDTDSKIKEGNTVARPRFGENNDMETPENIRESAFHDLTPERKVGSSSFKEQENIGTDGQSQLASVLKSANNGDQRDLKELEKMDSEDERNAQSLFMPVPGIL
ncbi:uncharacterized protein [Montipora capricornis]|uniref:uncharacterized protein n=1 Tax=Montipora capricornis TaxID=246305 RepID=UPI0035F17F85